jgi:hypothetical protein
MSVPGGVLYYPENFWRVEPDEGAGAADDTRDHGALESLPAADELGNELTLRVHDVQAVGVGEHKPVHFSARWTFAPGVSALEEVLELARVVHAATIEHLSCGVKG